MTSTSTPEQQHADTLAVAVAAGHHMSNRKWLDMYDQDGPYDSSWEANCPDIAYYDHSKRVDCEGCRLASVATRAVRRVAELEDALSDVLHAVVGTPGVADLLVEGAVSRAVADCTSRASAVYRLTWEAAPGMRSERPGSLGARVQQRLSEEVARLEAAGTPPWGPEPEEPLQDWERELLERDARVAGDSAPQET